MELHFESLVEVEGSSDEPGVLAVLLVRGSREPCWPLVEDIAPPEAMTADMVVVENQKWVLIADCSLPTGGYCLTCRPSTWGG
jgi:hypothetical protein